MSRPSSEGPSGGDRAAAGLVQRYRQPLVRYFARRGVSLVTAEDLAHDCFTRLFMLASRAHIDNEEAYLFQVAASVYTDHVRLAHTRHSARHVSLDMADLPTETRIPDRVLEGKEGVERLVVALGQLKPRTREIFLLNRVDGLTYTQIAVRLGITPSAVEKQMIKALAHINKRLGEWRR